MFTGIITDIGRILASDNGRRVTIQCRYNWRTLWIGASIACNGACLTVVDRGAMQKGWFAPLNDSWFTVELSEETLRRTAPGQWDKDRRVNLETALIIGDSLDGHIVTGHVDGIATVRNVTPEGESRMLEIEAPQELPRYIAEKGSVTLDGVSLTINRVDGNRFWVNIIPHTLLKTTLADRKPGDRLNLEIDMIARYVARLMGERHAA